MWRDPDWPLHYSHVSRDKGAPRAWSNGLTTGEVSAIHDRFASWLTSNGYDTSTPTDASLSRKLPAETASELWRTRLSLA